MQTQLLAYPCIDSKKKLKKACEQYWSDKIILYDNKNRQLHKKVKVDLIIINQIQNKNITSIS